MAKPSLAQVRDLIVTMLDRGHGWIGEGDEIAEEILDYIDGKNPNALAHWKRVMDDWVYVYAEPDEMRGPFDSRDKALAFIAELPEHATCPSPWGRTSDRNTYRVLTRDEYKAHKATSERTP